MVRWNRSLSTVGASEEREARAWWGDEKERSTWDEGRIWSVRLESA